MFTCYICAQRLPLATWKTGNNKEEGMRNTRQLPGSQVFVSFSFFVDVITHHSPADFLGFRHATQATTITFPRDFPSHGILRKESYTATLAPEPSLRLRAEFDVTRIDPSWAWNVMSSSCVLFSRVTFNEFNGDVRISATVMNEAVFVT